MNSIRILLFVEIWIILSLFVGCGHSVPDIISSKPKPKWVDGPDRFEKDDNIYLKSSTDNQPTLSMAELSIQGKVYVELVQAVKIRAGMEFDEAIKGTSHSAESVGEVRQRVINVIGEAVFSGLWKSDSYYEKHFHKKGKNDYEQTYLYWALYSIPINDFERAKQQAFQKIYNQSDSAAQDLMENSKQRFLQRRNINDW